ncbi:hypothetical protein ACT3CE_12770 [Marinifilum sp. RC60d5]|uniref:hypothetical protein n=1 Tax=Marinifilum sp. RC60d5 TaxID=3458414 RepID=UPI0040363DAE
MENNRDIFIAKLDRFIRKYYQNQLLRGVLLSLVLFLTYFLFVSFSEYYLYLSVAARTILFIVSLLFFALVVFFLILNPIIGLSRIGKKITYRQAIAIISKHFPHLQDRLLNTLELTELSNKSELEDNSLLLASINQRIESVRLLQFRKAISFKDSLLYLKYLIAVLFVIGSVYFLIPDLYSDSTDRLVHFNKKYLPPADFYFVLDSLPAGIEKGSDFTLKVQTKGKYAPKEVNVLFGNAKFLMKKESDGSFTYLFRNVNTDIRFFLESDKVSSEIYQIKVLSKPGVRNMSLSIISPAYTKQEKRVENNLGDISVSEGSVVSWIVKTEFASAGELVFSDSVTSGTQISDSNSLKFSRKVHKKLSYQIFLENNEFPRNLFAQYNIDVIPDLYPQINVSAIQDSLLNSAYYFRGIIKDDYGFSKLRFVYESENYPSVYIPISIQKNLSSQEFYFAFDFSTVDFTEGSNVKYHFEIFDNDKINGAKKSNSQQFNYYIPDSKQLYDLNTTVQDSISNQIEKGIDLSQSIQKDILRLQKNAVDASADKWQQKQLMQQISSKKNQLDDLLKNIAKENQRKNNLMNSTGLEDPAMLEKQKQIEDLLKKVMDPELEKLFEEFNKLAEDLKSEDLNKLGNQLKMSVNDFQKQLDRNLQLLERYEIELRTKQLSDRIEKLASEQDMAANKYKKDEESLKSKQESGKEKWQDIEEDLEQLFDKNSEIQKPYDFDNTDDLRQEIGDMIDNSGNHLENGKSGKAAKNMKETSKKQRNLAQKLSDNIAQSSSAQMSTNIDHLIRLMNNLIEFSFQQENVLNQLRLTNYRNPLYVKVIEQQGELKEEYALIQDSLFALSAQSPQVATLIGNKIFEIETELDKVINEANERRRFQANTAQQKVLSETNELSVFLSEALKQLMEQMANAMPGDQLGDKKGSKSSFPGLKDGQKSLKKMMEELISDMKEGKTKPGTKQKLGEFLQKQEMYRHNLSEMLKNGGLGNESEKILREVMKMIDKIETDVSNFSINSSITFRQNRILTRLLEAEKAHREKDFDKKRESKSGKLLKLSNLKEIFEYKRVRTDYDGVFYDSNVKMFEYYNKLYLDYMIKLNDD